MCTAHASAVLCLQCGDCFLLEARYALGNRAPKHWRCTASVPCQLMCFLHRILKIVDESLSDFARASTRHPALPETSVSRFG